MNKTEEGIWIGQKDLNRDHGYMKSVQNEFQSTSLLEEITEDEKAENLAASRRDFLKYLGFGLGAATVAASCETPIKRAIPYVIKPDQIVPGVATYYASTIVNGGDVCPVLVKTREGRPIKIEGNSMSSLTKGGTSARAQASVLSLYDVNRLREPIAKTGETWNDTSWSDLDNKVQSALSSASSIRVLTGTIVSPSGKKSLTDFTAKYPNAKVVTYDPVSCSGLLDANEESFGERVIADYHFDKAKTIVSFNADFLGTWISPIEYAADFTSARKIDKIAGATMSRLVQVENHMSLTGSNADNRILVKPSEQAAAVAYLYNQISGANISVGNLNDRAKSALKKLARSLSASKGTSLVVCGNNDKAQQVIVNAINHTLGNVGKTMTFGHASMQRQGNDKDFASLLSDMKQGRVDAIILNQVNPVYNTASGLEFAEALSKVKTKVAIAYAKDETNNLCDYIAPASHVLESWGDVEAKKGELSLIQPSIKELFNTRQAEASMLAWSGMTMDSSDSYRDYVKTNWNNSYFGGQTKFLSFQSFWDSVLHDGIFSASAGAEVSGFSGNISAAGSAIAKPSNSELEISFFEPVTVGNGQYSNNPWLQELPDPVNRCTWGNYLAVPVAFDGVKKFLGFNDLEDGDEVTLTIKGKEMTVPVVQQFGQMPGTVALALGYGRTDGGFAGTGVGVNVNDCLTIVDGYPSYFATDVSVSGSKGKEDHFSCVQYHHTMGVEALETKTGEVINADEAALAPGYGNFFQGFQGSLTKRSIIRKAHIETLKETVDELIHERDHHEHLNQQTLYPYDEYLANKYEQGHHWGMHVDLNACTGCGACAVACMAENNVPVVGKRQVSRHQEMTWLRIDRYFYGDVESPNAVYQPMMCQHCDNAPCENVCPVNASNHSSEGLNQMAYNRCVGTRYCANNCPYKVRRFNWLDYTTADIFPANQPGMGLDTEVPFYGDNLTRMVLNPDVTVRSRGVIEKCSFCVQRIQEGKLTAKREMRSLHENDVKSACQTACPTGAITFGDQNAKSGEFTKKWNSPMNYLVLEETNTRPSVRYTMKVNNKDASLDA